jgi:hypothetical protein
MCLTTKGQSRTDAVSRGQEQALMDERGGALRVS